MLDKVNHTSINTILLTSIIINFFLFLSPHLIFLIKVNLILFILLIFIFFYKFNNKIFLLLIVSALLIICFGSFTNQWDARSIWIFKAKRIFIDESVISFKDNYAIFSHPDYPNIGPAFVAGFANLIGYWNEIFPKGGLTLMFIPPFIILNKYFYNNDFLLIISLILFTLGKFLINGEMDGLISVYFSLSILTIYNFIKNNESKSLNLLTPFLLIIILSLLKLEGFIMSLIILFLTSFLLLTKKKINYKIIICLSIALVPSALWQFFILSTNISNDNTPYNYNIIHFGERFLQIKNYLLITKYLILNEKFLISVIFYVAISFWTKDKNIFIYGASIVIIYISVLYGVYLSTPLDIEWHLSSSGSRIIKPITLFLFIFSMYNINNKNYKNEINP